MDPDRGSPPSRLIAELRRRRVFHVAVVYGTVAFVLIQVADIAFPALLLPEWTLTALVLGALVGFPVAVALAWMFEVRREVEPSGEAPEPSTHSPLRVRPAALNALLLLGAVGLAATAVTIWRGGSARHAPELDPEAIAVLPFRVAGAQPSLGYLREGMLDLLATKLTGAGVARAVAPRTVLSSWREEAGPEDRDLDDAEALRVARMLGAGRTLLGEVVGEPSRLTINAAVFSTANGRLIARASVEGAADGLFALVDRLAAEVLALSAGNPVQRLDALTSASLPALRSYLEGQSRYRRGDYVVAGAAYLRALEQDTAFALAALGLFKVAVWTALPPGTDERARALAWTARDRLGERDRTYLAVVLGRRYPEPTPWAEVLQDAEAAVERFPDDPELWNELAEATFHFGAGLGIPRSLERAEAAFHRALALDPTYAEPVLHAVEIALRAGDTDAVDRLGRTFLRRDSTGQAGDVVRWNLHWATTRSGRAPAAFSEWPPGTRFNVAYSSLFTGRGIPEAARLVDELIERPLSRAEQERVQVFRLLFAVLAGRPTAAAAIIEGLASIEPRHRALRRHLLHHSFDAGDPAAAEHAASELAASVALGQPPDPVALGEWYWDVCVLELWRIDRGELGDVESVTALLLHPAAARASGFSLDEGRLCAAMIEAMAAHGSGSPDAPAALARLETQLRGLPRVLPALLDAGNLTAARIHEERGELHEALAAVQRRFSYGSAPFFRATQLRQQARLSALVGDSDGARAAFEEYLALRWDAEPRLLEERSLLETELAQLGSDTFTALQH